MQVVDRKELKATLDPFAKQILYWCSKYDFSFPRSCDIVSKYILHCIKDNDYLKQKYDISVLRGHYIIDEEETCDTFNTLCSGNPCKDCTCESVYQHTFLIFENKETKVSYIVDYTHYQFSENYGDLEETLLHKKFFKEELFKELSKYSSFIDIREQGRYLVSKATSIQDFDPECMLEEYFKEATVL